MDELAIQEIAKLGAATAAAGDVDGVEVWVVPDGYCIEVPDVEKHMDYPRRKRGTFTAIRIEDFIGYVNRHKTVSTFITYSPTHKRFVAVLDHHAPGETGKAGWQEHKAVFEPRWTPSWTAWTGFDDHWHDQQSFAEFLEERIPDIASPDGAKLLELVTQFKASLSAEFQSVKVLSDGTQQVVYKESLSAGGGKAGDIRVPETLALVLSPFDGYDGVEVTARLRIHVRDGGVKFMFKLGEEVRRVVDEAFEAMADTVGALAGIAPLRGTFS